MIAEQILSLLKLFPHHQMKFIQMIYALLRSQESSIINALHSAVLHFAENFPEEKMQLQVNLNRFYSKYKNQLFMEIIKEIVA